MVPQHFVALDALPLTANGKIDRHALPAPEPQRRRRSAGRAAVARRRSGSGRDLARAARRGARVGVHDNFFDLGGHSLQVSRAVIAFHRRSGVRLEARRMIFESLAQLARGIELPEGEPAPLEESANQPKGWFKRLFQRA